MYLSISPSVKCLSLWSPMHTGQIDQADKKQNTYRLSTRKAQKEEERWRCRSLLKLTQKRTQLLRNEEISNVHGLFAVLKNE